MKTPPDDWKDDRKLWDVLNSLKRVSPPTDFAYRIREKLAGETAPEEGFSVLRTLSLIGLRRWVWGMATAVASLAVLLVALQYHSPRRPGNGDIEIASIAENYEMLQDLEVIESLDELQ